MIFGNEKLGADEVLELLEGDVAADVGDGVGEWEVLGADFDAVLSEAALLNATVSGEGAEAFFFEDFACGVLVEEFDLGDGGCADEVGGVVELGADFHAAAAGDAVGERVGDFLLLREDAWAGAEVIGAINGNPGLDGLEVLEEDGAVDGEVADDGEFGEWFDADRLLEIIDER